MIIARAWHDAGYRKRLICDPHGTFAAEGVLIPKETPIIVTCDSETELNMVLGYELDDRPAVAPPETPDLRAVFAYIDARCREDESFKDEFLLDPTDTVRELGCELPPGVTVQVHLAIPGCAFFNLPLPPRGQLQADAVRSRRGSDEAPPYFSIPLVHRPVARA